LISYEGMTHGYWAAGRSAAEALRQHSDNGIPLRGRQFGSVISPGSLRAVVTVI
jgi:hypothetical protein